MLVNVNSALKRDEIRKVQKGLICVDRTVGGAYENYVTPEQKVPEDPLLIPWESNLTLGTSYSYRFDDKYKSTREVLNLLVDIVAKGGNLAINVGPRPNGVLPEEAMENLKGMGRWLQKFGDAIYGTRVCRPYKKDGIAFTRKADMVYAIETFAADNAPVKSEVWIPYEGKINRILFMESGEELALKLGNFETLADTNAQNRMVYADGFSYTGEPVIISEFGGIAFSDDAKGECWGYGGSVNGAEDYFRRLSSVVNAIVDSRRTCGYCYTQFTDVFQEVNGLVTIDRKVKTDLSRLNAIFTRTVW